MTAINKSILILLLAALPLSVRAQVTTNNPQGQARNQAPGACPGWGMGPGMMGPGMMGPGMMGPGMMGPGMMGPGWGMGPGMMGPGWGGMGYGPGQALNLSDKQRTRISEIQTNTTKQLWDLATKMNAELLKLQEVYSAEKVDPKQVGDIYGRIGQLRQQMAVLHAQAYNETMAVLTKQQRETLANMWHGAWGQGRRGPMHRGGPPANAPRTK